MTDITPDEPNHNNILHLKPKHVTINTNYTKNFQKEFQLINWHKSHTGLQIDIQHVHKCNDDLKNHI